MRISGTICEAGSGRAIENLIVRAYQRDLLFDELLGFATTRSDGSFEIQTRDSQASGHDRGANLFVRVLDATGEHEVYDTHGFPRSEETASEFEITIPPENLSPRFERRDRSADTPQEFLQALSALTPRVFVTPTLVFLNVALFGWLIFQGASPFAPGLAIQLEWGANLGLRTLDGEWWRLVTCLFLHGGILHLSLNCYVLWVAGQVVERLVGSASFAALYLVSGVLASLASIAWDPFAVSVGASGAIFGVWGALVGYALRQRDPVTLRGLLRLRNIALAFLVANILFGMTQTNIDLAAHIGGLVAGVGIGLLLSQPVSLKARAKRGPRLALLCAVSPVLIVSVTAALPRDAIDVLAEIERLDRAQIALLSRFNEAFAGETRSLTVAEMRRLLEDELLPGWNEARNELEELRDLPDPIRIRVDDAVRRARSQEAEWRTLAGDFGRFQDALEELQKLEDEATDNYEHALGEIQAGRLSTDDFIDVVYREVLSHWKLERKIEGLGDLREPLQGLATAIRAYANTREKAWSLYAEAVRSHDEALALASSEEHLRADSMIARWAGIPIGPAAGGAE